MTKKKPDFLLDNDSRAAKMRELLARGEYAAARALSCGGISNLWNLEVQVDAIASLMLGDDERAEKCYRTLHDRYARARPDLLRLAKADLARAGERGQSIASWFGAVKPLTEPERRSQRAWWDRLDPMWQKTLRRKTAFILQRPELKSPKRKLSDDELAAVRDLKDVTVYAEFSSLEPLQELRTLRRLTLKEKYIGKRFDQDVAAPLISFPELTHLVCRFLLSDLKFLTHIRRLGRAELQLDEGAQLSDLRGCADLRHLRVVGKKILSIEGLRNCARLETLKLDCAFELSDFSPLAALTELRELDLHAATRFHNPGLLAGLTKLRTLKLESTAVSDLMPIAHLSNLEELHLGICEKFSDLRPVANLKALRTLDIELSAVSDLGPLAGHPALEYMNVSYCPIPDLSPLASCPHLKRLQARTERPLTGLLALARGCPSLEHLEVMRRHISKDDAKVFKKLRPDVLSLEVPDCT